MPIIPDQTPEQQAPADPVTLADLLDRMTELWVMLDRIETTLQTRPGPCPRRARRVRAGFPFGTLRGVTR